MIRVIPYRGLLWLMNLAALSLATACSSTSKSGPPAAQGLSGADETIFVGDTIEKNYDPNVIMKRAEAFFEKEDYPEAIIEYQHFLDLHRAHILAPYAQFKLGESHFNMFKTVDRDPSPIHKALEAHEKLLRDFPGSRFESQASEKIVACQDLLAQVHLLIGKFYYRRDAYLAAAYRFEAILKEFPDRPIAADALYHLAKTYENLGAEDWAHEKLVVLAQRYPDHPYTRQTRSRLAQLNGNHKDRTVAKADLPGPNGHPSFKGSVGLNGHGSGPTGLLPVTLGNLPASAQTAPSQAPSPMSSGSPVAPPVTPPSTFCRLGVWC